ncbi:MAG: histidine triad nucleotide-binding protein [Clostridia bacterium]|nr:histidine triad nucleotide-binding protein [Clostridia bacterium]
MDCLFCKIVAGEIPNKTVYEDDQVLAFYDIAPKAPVHVLVIPKCHLSGVRDITPDTATVVGHIFEVIPQITEKLGLTDYRVVSNNGVEAGQTVGHLHFHILGGRILGEMG